MKFVSLYFIFFCLFFLKINAQDTNVNNDQTFENYSFSRNTSSVPNFHSNSAARGSQYLFADWKIGNVIDKNGQHVNQNGLLFNYDKMHNNLYMTLNKKTVYLIDHNDITSLTIFEYNKETHLKNIPKISESGLVIVLVDNSVGYSLFKTLKTKFIRSDYVTDGLTERGHDYDEYLDEPSYFILQPNGKYQNIILKRKPLKAFFKGNSKAASFFKNHLSDEIDENYLLDFILSLN